MAFPPLAPCNICASVASFLPSMKKRLQVLFVLLVIGLGFLAVRSITFNVNILDLLPPNIPEVKGLNRFMEDFGFNGELFVTLESKDDDAMLDEAAPSLATHLLEKKVTPYAGWQPAWMDAPETAAELPAYLWFNGPPEHLEALAARLEPEALKKNLDEAYATIASSIDPEEIGFLAYDPISILKPGAAKDFDFEDAGLGRGDSQFVSEDGLFRVIYLDLPEHIISYKDKSAWVAEVRAAVDSWLAANPDFATLDIHFTGEPEFQAEIGGGMQEDMSGSVGVTSLLILFSFWLMHRRLAPLFWMAIMLMLILSLTILAGRLLFDELTIMSVGFAAILIGLAIDYGVVILQEGRQHNIHNHKALIKMLAPSILWAAFTTAAVFYSLNFSSLPGISQLGTLVAIGILIGAAVMLLLYSRVAAHCPSLPPPAAPLPPERNSAHFAIIAISILLPLLSITVLIWKGPPPLYSEYDALRPKVSPASDALAYMGKRLSPGSELRLPLVIHAKTEAEMPAKLARVLEELKTAKESGILSSYAFFPGMWASAVHQAKTRIILKRDILPREKEIVAALDAAGFAEDPELLINGVFDAWRSFLQSPAQPTWPITDTSKRLLRRVMLTGPDNFTMLGFADQAVKTERSELSHLLKEPDTYLTGWRLLGPAVKPLVRHDIMAVFLPMAGILIGMLALVFRKWKGTLLALASILFSSLILLAIMRINGLQWNFLNVCAFPLLLGTGIDYSIHMILALRREKGDRQAIRSGIGRALVFCGLSTCIAFGSLATANNEGLSSLGIVCSIGITITVFTAIVVLPTWWRALHPEFMKK